MLTLTGKISHFISIFLKIFFLIITVGTASTVEKIWKTEIHNNYL